MLEIFATLHRYIQSIHSSSCPDCSHEVAPRVKQLISFTFCSFLNSAEFQSKQMKEVMYGISRTVIHTLSCPVRRLHLSHYHPDLLSCCSSQVDVFSFCLVSAQLSLLLSLYPL